MFAQLGTKQVLITVSVDFKEKDDVDYSGPKLPGIILSSQSQRCEKMPESKTPQNIPSKYLVQLSLLEYPQWVKDTCKLFFPSK